MPTRHAASDHASRFKCGVTGFGITLAPIVVLAGAQFLLAPQIVASVGGLDPKIHTWAVPFFRSELAVFYAFVASIICGYWVLTSTLGRGNFLRIRSANFALVVAGLTFAFATVVATAVPMPARLFKGACPVLGLSDTQPTFGFDGQSDCEAFANGAVPIVLLGLPLVLLVTSAILRVVVSRRG